MSLVYSPRPTPIPQPLNFPVLAPVRGHLLDICETLRNEGFYDDDIYDYLNNITLSVLHKKYENILNQLKK